MKHIEVNQLDADEFEIVMCDDTTPQGVVVVAGKEVALIAKNKLSEVLLFVSPLGLPVVCNLIEEQEDECCKTQCA